MIDFKFAYTLTEVLIFNYGKKTAEETLLLEKTKNINSSMDLMQFKFESMESFNSCQ